VAWLARLLFGFTLGLSLSLAGLVLVAPRLAGNHSPALWSRLLDLFADDIVVRRTALAGALGLATTAVVFFRPARPEAESRSPGRQ
jgi:hypothetical protein